MKIAFYIPILNVGGAEKVIINLLNELCNDDDNSYFLITDIENSIWISEIHNKIKLIHVCSVSFIFLRLKNLASAINKNNINLVVSHLTHANIHTLILKYLINFKLIIVEHNITSTYVNDIPKVSFVLNFLIKVLFKKAEQIICVSNATKNDLLNNFNLPSNKCKVIYNPLDFKKIKKYAEEPLNLEFAEKIAKRKYIATVARLEIQKNHSFLIDAIHHLLLEKNIALIIVGGGSLYNILLDKISEKGLKNHVFLTGYSNNPYPFISNASLLIHPARFEGFGLVLIEALYLNTNVISMNFETAYEILENGRLGIIVKDSKSLIEAINFKLNVDKDNLQSSSDYVKLKYNTEFISRQYINEFKIIASG